MRTRELERDVQRGAKLLDKRRPGWYRRIKRRRLDLSDCERCILGQEFGDFFDGADQLGVLDTPHLYGFDTPQDVHGEEEAKLYRRLEAIWRRLIAARRDGRRA